MDSGTDRRAERGDTVELKPCPFCGNEAVMQNVFLMGVGAKWFYVKCVECCAEINDPAPSEKMAANKWNRRADDE